jgi:hypothetical protein
MGLKIHAINRVRPTLTAAGTHIAHHIQIKQIRDVAEDIPHRQ